MEQYLNIKGANIKLLLLVWISLLVVLCVFLTTTFTSNIFTPQPLYVLPKSNYYLPTTVTANIFNSQLPSVTPKTNNSQPSSITPIRNSQHFMVSAFIDHRIIKTVRVISIIRRDSLQPLYCIYCSKNSSCMVDAANVEIHRDHFGFPFGASDVLCPNRLSEQAARIVISTSDIISSVDEKDFLPVRNKIERESFKFNFNFTLCVSSLYGKYNNVLQFAQTIEMYKLLGVQKMVIYNTSCGPDLEKLLRHYQREGFLEIVRWPIDKFVNPSTGWNFAIHKGDIQYYGQLVTLNECIYRNMYQSKYLLLNDIDEIIMPYKHSNYHSLMEDLQAEHKQTSVFRIENHIFPNTESEESGRFKRPEWKDIPGVNIMEHIYREPAQKNVYNPTKMIINPRNVQQTSVHETLKYNGDVYIVPFDLCHIVHVNSPLQSGLSKKDLLVDSRLWDFEKELIPNVKRTLQLSSLLKNS